jgi:S-adenosylmethionine-dependent methyltransferase
MQLDMARFQQTDKYVAYLGTTAGRLRLDLAWSNLCEVLPQAATGLRALDIGCGTGAFGLRLAQLGFHVDLLDASDAMLVRAREQATANQLGKLMAFHLGDAAATRDLFPFSTFDVVVCHNVLEYVDEPATVLRDISHILKKSDTSLASILVRNRFGEALKVAIKNGDSRSVETALTAEIVLESLYGESVRVFDPDDLRATMEGVGLHVVIERGVRVVSDYRECSAVTEGKYEQLRKVELLLGSQSQLAAVARYTQFIARPGADET